MLNKNVVNILQSLNSITNSVILKYPVTVLNNPAGDVAVMLDIEALDPTPIPETGIYNLSEFISTFKLFEDYTCNIEDNIVSIHDNDKSLQYLATSINVLDNFNKDKSLFERTAVIPSICSFTLHSEDIKSIKSAAGVFKDLSDVIIEAKDGDVFVKLLSTNSFNARSNSFSLKKAGITSTKEFIVKMPVENFNCLPASDYTFDIKYNAERDAYRILLNSTEIKMSVLMAIKKN